MSILPPFWQVRGSELEEKLADLGTNIKYLFRSCFIMHNQNEDDTIRAGIEKDSVFDSDAWYDIQPHKEESWGRRAGTYAVWIEDKKFRFKKEGKNVLITFNDGNIESVHSNGKIRVD